MQKAKIIGLIVFFSIASYFAQATEGGGLTISPSPLYGQVKGQSSTSLAAGQQVYYENVIKDIIKRHCGRCHSGMSRNLMDYDSLKAYVGNGMLWAMVSPGGPMNRFARTDAQTIVAWINSGAPEKPQAIAARFVPQSNGGGCIPGFGPRPFPVDVPLDQITYSNTIQYIIAKDCLECHSIPFRNLTTYKNVKYYVDNGLLKKLIQVGGSMHRFAGQDSRYTFARLGPGKRLKHR